ncbi:MAG: hypothetical protein M3O28_14280 [Actinomycetota bacterium]|nr:hypothetical protein [Actinomycetota bacterium]
MFRRPLIPVLLATAALATTMLTGCSMGPLSGPVSTGDTAPGASTHSASPSAPAHSAASAGSSFTVPTTCPSSADISAIMGIPAPPDPHQTATVDSLLCIYLTATQDGLIIDIEPSKGATPAEAEAQMAAQAPSGSGSTFASVSGFGDAAYSMTKNGAVSGLIVLTGSSVIYMVGSPSTVDGYERLAKFLLGV